MTTHLVERPHVMLPAEPETDAPPLLLLHGTGGTEHDLLPLRDHLAPGAAVLSPRGQVSERGLARWFRRIAEGVFDEDDLSRRADELADFVAGAEDRYDIEPGRWVAVGFSNGANIASALLLRHPGLLRGAVLFAAMVPYASPPAADLSGRDVIISNGARDPMITAEQTRTLHDQLALRGAVVQMLDHEGGHGIDSRLIPRIAASISAMR